jgi:hypothetical protein
MGKLMMTMANNGRRSTQAAVEYTGGNPAQSAAFFQHQRKSGDWVLKKLCALQAKYSAAPMIGFTWKPHASFFSPAALQGLQVIAKHQSIHVIRSRRNPLDVYISNIKHGQTKKSDTTSELSSHCAPKDAACIAHHLESSMGIVLPTDNLLERLTNATLIEDVVDAKLNKLGVSYLSVTYEQLYVSNTAVDEWKRIFEFLGRGPTTDLTLAKLQKAMPFAATHHAHHNVTLANYDQVRRVLQGTKMEALLH